MSEAKKPKTKIEKWHELFAGMLFSFFLFFVLSMSHCSFEVNLSNTSGVLSDALCYLYLLLAIVAFLAGLLVCLKGIEHHRKANKSRLFFNLILLFYVMGFLFIFL